MPTKQSSIKSMHALLHTFNSQYIFRRKLETVGLRTSGMTMHTKYDLLFHQFHSDVVFYSFLIIHCCHFCSAGHVRFELSRADGTLGSIYSIMQRIGEITQSDRRN